MLRAGSPEPRLCSRASSGAGRCLKIVLEVGLVWLSCHLRKTSFVTDLARESFGAFHRRLPSLTCPWEHGMTWVLGTTLTICYGIHAGRRFVVLQYVSVAKMSCLYIIYTHIHLHLYKHTHPEFLCRSSRLVTVVLQSPCLVVSCSAVSLHYH